MVVAPEQYQVAYGVGRPQHGNVYFLASDPAPKKPDTRMVATTGDGMDITRGWLGIPGMIEANPDKVLALYGQGDLDLYDAILADPQVKSTFQQRRLAVIARPWEIDAGADDAVSKAAAEALREDIAGMDWDDITDKMLYGLWFGYGVAEIDWQPRNGRWAVADIVVPDRNRFRYTPTGELRMLTTTSGMTGIALPDRKFWTYRAGATHHHSWYGRGLAHFAYWPWWFKKNGIKFWAKFLEKYGAPTAVASYEGTPSEREKSELLAMVRALSVDTGAIKSKTTEIDLIEATRGGGADYQAFKHEHDTDITKIILSQTMTTEDGSSRSQSETHMDVRDEVVRADSDLLCGSFNRQVVKWWTEFNFPGAVPPKLYRIMDDPEDVDTIAERDERLHTMGWQRTEESFKEVYGDGYERKEPPAPLVPPGVPGALGRPPVPGEDDDQPAFAATLDADVVDRLVADLAGPGVEWIDELARRARDKLTGVRDLQAARVVLLEELERMLDEVEQAPEGALAGAMARASMAARAAEQAGLAERIS